jgi:hypothetical protein
MLKTLYQKTEYINRLFNLCDFAVGAAAVGRALRIAGAVSRDCRRTGGGRSVTWRDSERGMSKGPSWSWSRPGLGLNVEQPSGAFQARASAGSS